MATFGPFSGVQVFNPPAAEGGGGPITPSDLSGLELWVKADSESYNDDDPVGTITDRSGNGRNFTQTGGQRPTYKTSIVNGKAVYRFSGLSSQFASAAEFMTGATAGEMYAVVKLNNDPALTAGAAGAAFGTASSDFATVFPYTDGVIYEGFGTTARKTTSDPATSLSSAFRLYNVWSAANDYGIKIDAASHYTSGANTVSFNPSGNTFYIGASDGSVLIDGDIAEICVFSRKLNSTERGQMEAYFDTKYNLAY